MNDRTLRVQLIATARELTARRLTHGKSGNVSVRRDATTFLITPTGIAYDMLQPEDIAVMDFNGRWFGQKRPSSEWRFHSYILKARPDAGAIVHTHSRHATALACTGRGIPAFHYMVAVAGGADIRCAPYSTFGTQALSGDAVAALQDRKACLLANHGLIALGRDLDAALALAGEVENLAGQYTVAMRLGGMRILDEGEMATVVKKFATYGRQDAPDDGLAFGGDHL
ncbi:MAG: class II aldolase/adducin family protein [Rhodospirillaceae bacterium]